MKKEEFFITTSDGVRLHCVKWFGDFKPKGIIQISHGMMEYIERYDDFANFLVENGYFVFGHSHRGHGKTAEEESLGIIEDGVDFLRSVLDLKELTTYIKSFYKDESVFLLGHSYGSFLAQAYVLEYTELIDGLILSGTSGKMKPFAFLGLFVTLLLKLFYGGKHKSRFLNYLVFGPYNLKFKPNRTKADWLTSDETEVDKYLNNKYCGKTCSLNFFKNLFRLFLHIHSKKSFKIFPVDLPILIIKGEKDPVGENLSSLVKEYVDKGVHSLKINIYKDGRHECLNEKSKAEVYKDILKWLEGL